MEKATKQLTIEDFTLISMLGKGAYAKVCLVRKKDTKKIFAMKMLKKSYLKQKK